MGHRWLWGSGHKGKTGEEEAREMGKAPREIFIRGFYFVWEGAGQGGKNGCNSSPPLIKPPSEI